ncbi:MAG: hypothetical protein JKX83_03615 [Pseudomonadales bacterium]|nr:hypothetical protein [Pseudomonadales bacterium]
MADTSTNIALFGLMGAFVGVVPGVLGVLVAWLKSRDSVATHLKNIEVSKAELDFITAWLSTASCLPYDEATKALEHKARARLHQLIQTTETTLPLHSAPAAELNQTGRKSSRFSWFYIYSGFLWFMILGSSIDDEGDVSGDYFMAEMSGDGGFAILMFVIIWVVFFVRRLRSK